MKMTVTITLAAALLGCHAAVYAQTGAQANSSATSSTAVESGRPGAQVSSSTGASSSAQAGQGSASLSNGAAVNAALTQPVDAKKNKPGDPITAKTTQATKSGGKVIIPKGSKLVGHVTQAKARTKGESESALGIVFDKAILKNGREIPLNVSVQALAAAQTAAFSSVGGDDLSAGGGATAAGHASSGGALSGVRSTAGATAGTVTNTAANAGGVAGGAASGAVNSTANVAGATRGANGGLNAAGQLTSTSQGVFGMGGVNLSSATSTGAQGSLITSTSRNVHLDSGTQILLVAQGEAAATSGKQ
jgi:hypothetical protein